MGSSQAAAKESRAENFTWEGLGHSLELKVGRGDPSPGMTEAHSQAKTRTEQEKPKASVSYEAGSLYIW